MAAGVWAVPVIALAASAPAAAASGTGFSAVQIGGEWVEPRVYQVGFLVYLDGEPHMTKRVMGSLMLSEFGSTATHVQTTDSTGLVMFRIATVDDRPIVAFRLTYGTNGAPSQRFPMPPRDTDPGAG